MLKWKDFILDLLYICESKDITIINRKFHIELEAETDFREWAFGAIPLIVNNRLIRGVKLTSGIALGPWKFSVEFRFNMGMK